MFSLFYLQKDQPSKSFWNRFVSIYLSSNSARKCFFQRLVGFIPFSLLYSRGAFSRKRKEEKKGEEYQSFFLFLF
jgi:hypothetical protein